MDNYQIVVTVSSSGVEASRNRTYVWPNHDVPVSTVVNELQEMVQEVVDELTTI